MIGNGLGTETITDAMSSSWTYSMMNTVIVDTESSGRDARYAVEGGSEGVCGVRGCKLW